MKAWLENDSGKRIPIAGRCTFGRWPENTVVIASGNVSRWHALIQTTPDEARWLVDLGSRNGVLLNGRRLREPAELAEGDEIQIGGSGFCFHSRDGGRSRKQRDQRQADIIRQRTNKPNEAYAPTEQAAVIVSGTGEVKYVSERARELLASYFPEHDAHHLPAAIEKWLARVSLTAASIQMTEMLGEPLVVAQGDRRLQVRLVEADASQRILLLFEQQHVFSPEQLEQLGLTRRESEVLHWMAEGKTNPEIGTILGSSPATVKKQAEHIFAKLNVENRATAILRVLEMRLQG